MRSYSFDPGLLNGRLLQEPPTMRSVSPPGNEYWDERAPRGENPGGLMMRGGYYDNDEVARYSKMAKRGWEHVQDVLGYSDAEAKDFTGIHGSPQQGRLFDPSVGTNGINNHEGREQALSAHQTHWMPRQWSGTELSAQVKGEAQNKAEGSVMAGLYESRMSNDLIKALGGRTYVSPDIGKRDNVAGFYRPGFGRMGDGEITIKARAGYNEDDETASSAPSDVLRHEMGHRADYRSMDAENDWESESDLSSKGRSPYVGSTHANPRAEGIADGFDERYRLSGPVRGFSHFTHTGYSVNNPRWTPTEAAVYAAARAHFRETGENPTAGSNTEYLHKMMMTSPHAVRALRQTGLKQEGAKAVDSYRRMRQVGTQMSMFSERTATPDEGPKRILGYEPHPALTGQSPWSNPDRHRGVAPGESLRFESMDRPVYDIPDDHKPKVP